MTDVADELRDTIRSRGPITFADFMRAALYSPRGGYYVRRSALGAEGDFYTAPLTHPVFGALVARHLAQLWRDAGSPTRYFVIEPGAGTGRLAADVTEHAAAVDPGFAVAMRYAAVDVAPPRVAAATAAWVRADGLPLSVPHGVILANELLDAMPVHRVTMVDRHLREIRVALDARGAFVEELSEPAAGLAERLDSLGVRLSEGFRAEIDLGLDAWAAEAAAALGSGHLVVIDYGHEAAAYYDESRRRGTLRCYHRHTLNMDPYQHVGDQDISVHVELTSLRRAAVAAGFAFAGSATQADFLRSLGFDAYRRDVAERGDLSRAARLANLRALDTLVEPSGMGAFHVLVFRKGDLPDDMAGLRGGSAELTVRAPLPRAGHMPLGPQPEPVMPTWPELLR
jgi:SAM-dependent MidA family methyltransferase